MGPGQVLAEDSIVLCMFGAVTNLLDNLESELHGVCSLCNICDSFGEELGVRFPLHLQVVQHL